MNKRIVCLLLLLAVAGLASGLYYKLHICRAELSPNRQQLFFDGQTYLESTGEYHESNHLLCRTKDGLWSVYEVVGDTAHDTVVLRSFLDQYLFRREGTVQN